MAKVTKIWADTAQNLLKLKSAVDNITEIGDVADYYVEIVGYASIVDAMMKTLKGHFRGLNETVTGDKHTVTVTTKPFHPFDQKGATVLLEKAGLTVPRLDSTQTRIKVVK